MEELVPHKAGLEMSTQAGEITGIVAMLEKKRDEPVSERVEVESRWIRDLQQFEGNTIDRVTKADVDHRSAIRKAPPIVHLTRARTLAIAARIINMLVPSNERSWDIDATPVASMDGDDQTPVTDPRTGQIAMMPNDQPMDPQAMQQPDEMRPVTRADLMQMEQAEAEKRATSMRRYMDDQLTECHYNSEQRKIIIDGCKLGTGVLEGPVIGGSYRKSRSRLPDGTWVAQMEEHSTPKFKSVDPWNFYPLPAEHIAQCEGVFIDQPMTRREVQELKLLPGFDAEMINEILAEEPHYSEQYASSLLTRAQLSGETLPLNNRYNVWKYTGSLNRRDMEQLGIDVDSELDVVDPIIEAWFANTRLLKVKRHALEGAYRLPYCVWNYEENETSMFGYGVPYIMRDSDRVMQSTWHMVLHNAALNAGSQLVRKKGVIEPADGDEQITGGLKQWYLTDPEASVADAFQIFHFDLRVEELLVLHDRARQNADEELAFPLIAQGEPTEAVPTSSGLAMLMNAANVVQRRIAQSYDDEIIEPSIGALYDWNMIYLKDDAAKGDMTIKPLGATKLVVKDMQVQHLMAIAQMTTNDRFAPLMDDAELLRSLLKAAEIDPDTLMLSEEELAQRGPSERDVAETQKLQAEVQKLMSEIGQSGQGIDPEQTKALELQYQYDKLQAELQIQQMKLDQAALEAAKAENVKLTDINSRFELGVRNDETKRMLAALDDRRKQATEGYLARLRAEEVAMKRLNVSRGFDTYG